MPVILALPGPAPAREAHASADTAAAPSILEELQKEDKDYFNQDVWDFDLAWEDSVISVLDSVGLDSLRDRISKGRPWLSTSFSYNTETLNYNRVEGLVAGLGGDFKFGRSRKVVLHAEGAYAFASEKFRYDTRLRWSVGRVGFFAGYSDRVVRFSSNQVHGNSLRALVGGSDDQDYLHAVGGAAAAGLRGDKWRATVGYRARQERSMGANTEFGIFGKMRDPNPPVDEGIDRIVFVLGHVGSYSRDRIRLDASHIVSGGALGGDFAYNRSDFDLRTRRYILGGHELTFRGQVALAASGASSQQQPDVGGLSLVRGYKRGARRGDRSAAGRVEYFIPYDVFRRAKVPLLESAGLQLVPWADAGRTWNGDNDTWIASAGLGVQLFIAPFRYFSYLRLDLAVPMGPDRPDDVSVTLSFAERNF